MLFTLFCVLMTPVTADERPQIQSEGQALILETNSSLELTCVGGAELSWEWPERAGPVTTRRSKDSLSGQQRSELHIARLAARDIGKYRCVRTDKASQRWTSDPLYVYVTSDTEPLFLDAGPTDLEHFVDQPSVIPCRLTNPNASVALRPRELFGGGDGDPSRVVTFDPQVGFTVGAELWDYSGNVSCRAELAGRVEVQRFSVSIVVAPQLMVSEDVLVISESDRLELVCSGSHEIRWSTPDGLAAGRLVVTEEATHASGRQAVYRSTLRLDSALWTDTGRYSCAYRRYAGLASAQLNASVYVFVRSDDPERFFLPEPDLEIRAGTVAGALTIPCRLTDPALAAQLELLVFYTETSLRYMDFEDHWQADYELQVGYRISPRSPRTPAIRRLTMSCSLNQTKLSYSVSSEEHSKNSFEPSILPSATRLIQGTGSFEITCEIVMPFFTYPSWESEFIPDIQISYPNQEIIPEEAFQQTAVIYTIQGLADIRTYRTLTFKNVSLLNDGLYTCRVKNIELDETVNTSISILERGFVRLTHYPVAEGVAITEGGSSANDAPVAEGGATSEGVAIAGGVAIVKGVEGQPQTCLRALLEAFPTASYRWSRAGRAPPGNGSEATLAALESPLGENYLLLSGCLSNLTISDGGTYNLTAWNSYEMRSLTFRLVVLEKPEVNLTVSPLPSYLDPPLFYDQQDHTLECRASGNPPPVLTLLWCSCQDQFCDDIEERSGDGGSSRHTVRWTPDDDDQWLFDRPRVSGGRVSSASLTIRSPPHSGVFRCLARSPSDKIQEPALADIEYRLVDFPFVFPAIQVEEKVFVSHPANLTCRASIYAFTDVVRWDWTASGNASEAVAIEIDDPRVWGPALVGYHYQSGLAIADVSANNTGIYRCRAQKKDSDEFVVVYEVRLVTKEIVPPTFTRQLLPIYHLDRKGREPVTLECQVSGAPRPSLAWFKDGRPLTDRNHSLARLRPEVTTNDTSTAGLELGRDVSWQHGGTYECCVRDAAARVCSATTVEIGERPTAKIKEEVYTVSAGKSLDIECQPSGLPDPTVTWEREVKGQAERSEVSHEFYSKEDKVLSLQTLQEGDEGKYFCVATNRHGRGTDEVTLVIQADSSLLMPILVAGIIAGFICLVACICMVLMAKKLCLYTRKAKRNSQSLELGSIHPRSPRLPMSPFRMSFREEFADQLPFDPKWEFPRDRLKLGAVIGQGAFGMVLKGVALGIKMNDRYVPVAVKTVKSDASQVDRKALFVELKMLIQVGHHLNVVNFLGACTQDSPPLVIVEFCPYGNLCDYVRSKRDSFNARPGPDKAEEQEEGKGDALNYADLILREACVSEPLAAEYELVDKEAKRVAEKCLSVEDLVCFCFQVARGMEFLASRKCIHRDLAARNVLLAENNVVKICDFGLARSLYHDSDYIGSGKGLLPIKWMAPEAIFDKVFTTYSDIWSFGIFTWEVFSLGGSPYPGIQVDERFYDKMKSGYRMSCPEHAPREVYQLMLECWSDEPKDRPMFSELTEKFGELLESNTRQEYIDLNIPYQEGHYCELDFGKSSGKRKTDTITEETDATEPASESTQMLEDSADPAHFDDPTYHRGPRGATAPSPDVRYSQEPSAAAVAALMSAVVAAEGGSPAAPSRLASGEMATAARSSTDAMPEDPYKRGSDDQLHTYTSVRGFRPPPRPTADSESAAGDRGPPPGPDPPLLPEDDRIHAYTSIRGARPNRTNGAPSPTEPEDRPHLYASIKLARPRATSPDPGPAPAPTEVVSASEGTSNEVTTLLAEPAAERESPPNERTNSRPALPKRDFSTTSWSPETQTLLSNQDSDQQLIKQVYV